MSCFEKYPNYSDEQLALLSAEGDRKAFRTLLERYNETLLKKAQSFAQSTPYIDDYYQEALISFYRATQTYKNGKEASFRTYFTTCVTNALISAKRELDKSSDAEKVSFNEETGKTSLENVNFSENDPQNLVERQETIRSINEKMNTLLSDFERQTLKLYLGGNSYSDIAVKLNTTEKAVDNALQRVRRKLKHSGKTD